MSPSTKRSGAGHAIAPAVKPAVSFQSISVGTPESPGLRQYTCQPGAIARCRSSHTVAPGAAEPASAISSALTGSDATSGLAACATAANPTAKAPINVNFGKDARVPTCDRTHQPRVPAQAGTHFSDAQSAEAWVPAFAGNRSFLPENLHDRSLAYDARHNGRGRRGAISSGSCFAGGSRWTVVARWPSISAAPASNWR